jgi:hypothetical protein
MFRNLLHLLPQIVSIEVILTGEFRDDYMEKPNVLKCSSNLEKLTIRMNHNGNIIRTYLPNLTDFRLNIGHDKIIFYPDARWVSNSASPTFESVRTIGLQSRGRHSMNMTVKPRFFTNVTTIEPPREFDDDDWNDVSNHINLTRVKKLIINGTTLIEALPTMMSLSILKFQYSCTDFKCFKKFSSPIFQLKELILTDFNYLGYEFDRNELTIIRMKKQCCLYRV